MITKYNDIQTMISQLRRTDRVIYLWIIYSNILTSVDTEMCCPKGKCGCQYFILLTLKKKIHGHRGPGFFNKKLILDY